MRRIELSGILISRPVYSKRSLINDFSQVPKHLSRSEGLRRNDSPLTLRVRFLTRNEAKQFTGAFHSSIAYHTGVIRMILILHHYDKRK